MNIQYAGLADVNGPLVALEGVTGAAYEEIAELHLEDGSRVSDVWCRWRATKLFSRCLREPRAFARQHPHRVQGQTA